MYLLSERLPKVDKQIKKQAGEIYKYKHEILPLHISRKIENNLYDKELAILASNLYMALYFIK
jgi:hypothetical protein